MVVVVYSPAMRAGFIWDDDSYVTKNRTLHGAEGLRRIWFEPTASPQYYPLVFTTFWLEQRCWGLAPAGYHVVNILLHAAGSVMLWRVLRRLQIPGALLAASLFAVHPVQVESVAWITERKNVLSALFYFAAAGAYLRFAGFPNGKKSSPGSRAAYAASLLLFLCGLLSKTVVCSLPAALLLILGWKRGRITHRDILTLAPMFVAGAAFGLVTVWLEHTHVGAGQIDWNLSWLDRVLLAGRALCFYAGKLVWPADLCFVYPRWTIDAADGRAYLPGLVVVLVIAGLFRLRRRIGRGPLAAAAIFIGTLTPALGFFDVFPFRYSYVADHFQYLATPALLALAATVMAAKLPRPPAVAVGAVVLLSLTVLTRQRCIVFQTEESLWRDTLSKNDRAWMAHQNLGVRLDERGQHDEAHRHFQRALAMRPEDAKLHVNLGINALHRHAVDQALVHLFRAREIDPNSASVFYNLGTALVAAGRYDEAEKAFRRAVEIQPDEPAGHFNLGALAERADRIEEAACAFQRAIAADDSFIPARWRLARLQLRIGLRDEAVRQLRAILKRAPEHGDARRLLQKIERQTPSSNGTAVPDER